MHKLTRELWAEQDRHPGDRLRLFSAIAEALDVNTVLYPGSFVDLAPSFVSDSVTYVNSDRRAAKFFADAAGVDEIIARHRQDAAGRWRYIHADYTSALDVPDVHFDLLVSLYAGFVSEHCTRYLRPSGFLLVNPSHGDAAMASIDPRYRLAGVVNPSHGDAAMASIDPRYRLAGVVKARSGDYRIDSYDLGRYLIPKRSIEVSTEMLHRTGRGIAYTRPAFAYVFQLEGG